MVVVGADTGSRVLCMVLEYWWLKGAFAVMAVGADTGSRVRCMILV